VARFNTVAEHSAYYQPLGRDGDHEHFTPTEHTVSVWGDELQHGGPPSGLLTRALLRHESDPGHTFSRVSVDILGAIGLGENRVSTTVLRPGRQISLVQSELGVRQADGTFRVAARATGWRMAAGDTSEVEHYPMAAMTPGPDDLEGTVGLVGLSDLGPEVGSRGFVGTLEYRAMTASARGWNRAWIRPTLPLVAGEQPTDLEKFFTVLDVANGFGTRLPFGTWTFMNTDTTVHLFREPVGDWTGIEAEMGIGPSGYGATVTDLFDARGPVARAAQTVLVRPNR
jgi:hypothetical protein